MNNADKTDNIVSTIDTIFIVVDNDDQQLL
jgi:hypothetical protein